MAKIIIEMEPSEDIVDDTDPTGLDADGYDELMGVLMEFGHDIEIRRA
jgi:hypothetical protein